MMPSRFTHSTVAVSSRPLAEEEEIILKISKCVGNFGDSRDNVFDRYGDFRENLLEILAVVTILSPISSVCGIGYRARLVEYRALLVQYRALLVEHRDLLIGISSFGGTSIGLSTHNFNRWLSRLKTSIADLTWEYTPIDDEDGDTIGNIVVSAPQQVDILTYYCTSAWYNTSTLYSFRYSFYNTSTLHSFRYSLYNTCTLENTSVEVCSTRHLLKLQGIYSQDNTRVKCRCVVEQCSVVSYIAPFIFSPSCHM